MRRTRHVIATASALILLCATGCSPRPADTQPDSPAAGWPEMLKDFTITWSAEPGIDLTTGPAVAVRAYVESYYLAYLTTDEKYLYPGFQNSVEPNTPDGPDGTEKLWPVPFHAQKWVGTARHHILRIDTSGRQATAVGCVFSYGSASETDFGLQPNIGGPGPNGGISAFRVQLTAPENATDLSAQRGPSRSPFKNVFAGWRVSNYQGGFLLLAEWTNNSADVIECQSRAEQPPADRDYKPGNSYPRSNFPTLPASPGWPADEVSQ
ncbi:hypothetical protein FBY28_4553 [Arthrobacter sp. SLBN-53]|nr:hypothetical protein FBY28_4553 [Arthrobacter sp. SLBN-53]